MLEGMSHSQSQVEALDDSDVNSLVDSVENAGDVEAGAGRLRDGIPRASAETFMSSRLSLPHLVSSAPYV
jgi:hypothetical protein